jgi:hypothetical protein
MIGREVDRTCGVDKMERAIRLELLEWLKIVRNC